ncbi:MAG: peptidylprolyl isomerase [Gammaproteobacteria bacterium]|nr:peptidylprolyl isomerase [Gammaproteobacteria bacterium]
MRISLLGLAIGLGLAVTAAAARAPLSTRGVPLDRVVAVVNDGVVLESERHSATEEVRERLGSQNVALPAEAVLRSQVLERLVLEEIQAQRAERAGITVSDEQVNRALEDIARRNAIPFAELPEKLASQGVVYADYRGQLKREIQRQMLRARDVVQRISISPRELDLYLEQQKQTATAASEYNVSHILIAVAQDAPPAVVAEASKRAQDIVARARSGADFAQLAVTYSASQTALEGGALGWRKGPELPTFLADVVARLEPGGISDVLQTATGFHIVRLNDKRSTTGTHIVEQVHLRHILLKTNEVMDDATVRQKLAQMRERILAGEDFAVLAKTTSEDPASAVNGGDLGWAQLSSYVGAFSAEADRLGINEISEPFRSDYGWHIVQMLGRRQFDNTETAAREQAYDALRDARLDEATEAWLQQLRDEAYVDILI